MHDEVMLNGGFVHGLLLGNCGYQTIESRLSTKMYNDVKAPQ